MKNICHAATDAGSIRTGYLHDVVNDTRARAFCGPTAVSAITGEPISRVRDAFRFVRHGAGWTRYDRAPSIKGTYVHEIERVLRLFGYVGVWLPIEGLPTFAAYLGDRSGPQRTNPCVVAFNRHVAAVSGWVFCDTISKGQVVDADAAPGRRKRVKEVFVITRRTVPVTHIPTKAVPIAAAGSPAERGMVADTYANHR